MALSDLKRIGLLKKLPAKDLKRILAIAKTRNFRAGEIIFNKSESANTMFVVESGRVKIFSRSSSKKRKTFAYLGRGSFFGEMAIIDDKARSAAAEAVSDHPPFLGPGTASAASSAQFNGQPPRSARSPGAPPRRGRCAGWTRRRHRRFR